METSQIEAFIVCERRFSMSISKDTSGRLQALAVRNIEFFRPKPEDLPWELLAAGSAQTSLETLRSSLDLDYTRVASRIEPPATIGIYSMRRIDERRFEMLSVAVAEGCEHQMLGRRLLGHALGLAESKAAREVMLAVCSDNTRALDMAQRYGFVPADGEVDRPSTVRQLRFELTPE